MSSDKGRYIVMVSGKLGLGQGKLFKEIFTPLAKYVQENEEGALAYQLSLSEVDPDKLIIFERYTNKEYVEQVHWQSDAFKAFQAGVREAGIEWLEKDVHKYYETEIGYMNK